jgi:glycosyltransferase involved in cell wall biosynthesis
MKVLEALTHGRPVVTSPAGVEGLTTGGAVTVLEAHDHRGWVEAVAGLLADPERRAAAGRVGRAAVMGAHDPAIAASARVEAIRTLWPDA